MARRAHLAVGQDLCNRVFGRGALLAGIGTGQMRDVVGWVVVADVLQGSGDGFNQIVLADSGHGVESGRGESEGKVLGES